MHFVRLEIVAVVMLFVLHGDLFAEETNVTDIITQRIQNATTGNSEQAARTLSYRIGNALSNQYREEHRDDQGTVRGSYGFRTPLGEFREVKYRADESGFRAHVVSNEPGVSEQNPADVQVRKVFPHPPSENLKQNQKLLVSEAYSLQNNLPTERKSNQFANDPLVQELMRIMKIPFPLPKDKKESPENYDDHHINGAHHPTDDYRPAVVHNPIAAQLPTGDHSSTTNGYFPTGDYHSADDHHSINYGHPIDVPLPANEYRFTSEHRPADHNRPTDDHRPSEYHRQNDGHRLSDIYQENRKIVPGSSEIPLELEYLINLWRKQKDNLQTRGPGIHSFQESMHQKFPGDPRPLTGKVPPFLLKEEKKHLSKEELPSLSEQSLDNSYHQRNNWVLGFIPFGIRTDKITEMVKKLSGDRNTQNESNDDTNSALFFNFKSSASPLNHINKKNCKVDGVPNSGAMTSHFVNGISTGAPVLNPPGLKEVSEIRNNVYGSAQGQSKNSEAEDNGIYMIQSIFAKRLAGLLGSTGIFPPHLLPHSNNKELNYPFPMYPFLNVNRTEWEKSQQQAVGNQPLYEKEKIDSIYPNPHSVQRWKDLLSPVQPTSAFLSNTQFSPDTLFKSHAVVSSTNDGRIHNIDKRGENQSHHMLTPEKTDKGWQDKEQVQEFIMRNFFNGMMYSSNIETNDQQEKIEDTNRDPMFNSFQRNRDTHNGRTRTSLNGDQPAILDLPPWSANRHRRFEIPPILRPLFDSKGVPVKPEDVPIHLHRFMPPKSQYPDSDRSFRFAIPRPVPPRSVVVPPKPPLIL